MKKNFLLTFGLMTLLSCAKAQTNNPFGILPNHTAIGAEIKTAKSLGVQYMRTHVILSDYTGTIDDFDQITAAGFKVILNVNFGEVQKMGMRSAVPFPTDLQAYKATLSRILDKYHPALLVVENEETNDEYHSGSPDDYINELRMAISVAHARGIKVTNGGITTKSLVLMTYQDYYNRGMAAQATDFANRAIGGNIVQDLPGLERHAPLKKKEEMGQAFVNAYKTMDLDYVNFHWYEPVMQRVAGAKKFARSAAAANVDQPDFTALTEVVDYLKRATGKQVITNEIGQLNDSPAFLSAMLQKIYDLQFPIAVWYSGDQPQEGKPMSLHDASTGALKGNGQAFASFISAHYH